MISTQKHKKYKHYRPEKLINMNILPGKEMQPPDQRRAINRAKSAYFSLVKSFEKQTKTIEEQGKKQIKANEDNEKHLAESNKLIKKDFHIDRDSIPLDEQKKYLINLLKKNLMSFRI